MATRSCGECLMNNVEIVELAGDGKCPRCGADYGPDQSVRDECGEKSMRAGGHAPVSSAGGTRSPSRAD